MFLLDLFVLEISIELQYCILVVLLEAELPLVSAQKIRM